MNRCPSCRGEISGRLPVCPHCGGDVDLDEPADELLGQVIGGKYQIVEQLSEGGMGRVYRATQTALGLDVAVKVIRPELAAERQVARRFLREARAAAQLSHPNCVNIFDFGESDGRLYLAMELLRGDPLDVVLTEGGPMAPARVVDIATQVLEVLDAAHRLSIVHRDLKPENIVVDQLPGRPDFVKVVDFGIAKITDPLHEGGTRLTGTGMVLGTPAYMAPEQVLGEPIDTRADFYSLGVVCYELLAGVTPFTGNIGEMLRAHLSSEPPPLEDHRADVPAPLAALIHRVLSKDREQRPATASELARALRASLRGGLTATAVGVPDLDAGVRCGRCGAIAGPEARFCASCGAAIGRDAGGDRFGDLRRHLPDGVVDAVAALGGAADHRRRELVVAVLDLAGPLSADSRGRALRAELGSVLAATAEVHRGRLEPRPAGGAIVTFGIDGAMADDVERAVRASLEMREAVVRRAQSAGVDVQLTAAVHAGPASISPAGEIDPIGDLLELPSRLVAATDAGRVIVSDAVAARLGGWCRSRRMPPARIRGHAGAVARHEVIAVTAAADSVASAIAAPLTGRDELIAEIVAAAEGGGVVIDVEGEIGVGKSRVMRALAAPLTRAGLRCIEVGPEQLAAAVLRAVHERAPIDELGLRGDRLELLRRWRSGGRLADAGPERDAAIAAAVHAALAALAARAPVALHVDGLERVRDLGAALVAQIAAAPTAGLSLIAASRSGHPRPWADLDPAPRILRFVAPPLAADEIEAMLAALFAPAPVPAWMSRAIAARAGGSPRMALELVGALLDAGAIARDVIGGWKLSADPVDLPAAASFAALIGQRIDGLDAGRRGLCAALAVAGGELDRADLEALAGREISADLADLASRQLIAVDGPAVRLAGTEVAEIIAGHLGEAEDRRWHAAIAARLAAAGDADPEIVGEHFAAAGQWSAALPHLEQTARDADALGGPGVAAPRWTRAADVARRIHAASPGVKTARRCCKLGLRAGAAWLEIGDIAELGRLVRLLAATAADANDPAIAARVERLRARLELAAGDARAALRGLDDVVASALALRDSQLYAEAHADLGEAHEKRGDLGAAADCLVRSLELAQRGTSDEVKRLSLRVLGALARVLIRRGDLDRASSMLEQSLQLARELGDPVSEARALGNMAGVHHGRGDLVAAVELAQRSLDASRRCGDLLGAARQLNNLGTLAAAAGDRPRARRWFDEAYDSAKRIGWREGMATAAAGRNG
jgi:tetratricopeptide (TPR) repeat protein